MPQHETSDDGRVPMAIGEYVLGHRTLGEAAELAAMNRWEFRDLLVERGVQLRTGPRDMDEAVAEAEVALGTHEDV